jgi:hypothetical protein
MPIHYHIFFPAAGKRYVLSRVADADPAARGAITVVYGAKYTMVPTQLFDKYTQLQSKVSGRGYQIYLPRPFPPLSLSAGPEPEENSQEAHLYIRQDSSR